MKADYLFENASLLSDGTEELSDAVLAVAAGKILYAGAAQNAPEIIAKETVDCQGGLITPGLINGHTHLAMTLFRSVADDMPLHAWLSERIWPLEEKLDDNAVYYDTLLSALELLRFGVTAVNDMYFFMNSVAQAVEASGLRALLSVGLMDATPGAEQRLKNAVQLYKDWHGTAHGRIRVAFGPHAEYTCSLEYLRQVADLAGQYDAPVHIHISETAKEHHACRQRHGLTPIGVLEHTGLLNEHLLAAHCVHVEPSDIEKMAKSGASVLHCPGSNLKLGSGIAPLNAMLEAGVNVALGTDGAASNNNLDVLEEVRLGATLHKGTLQDACAIPARQAFALGTAQGAKALHLDNVGRLEAGYDADLVLWDTRAPHWQPAAPRLSQWVYAAQSCDVRMTMIQGVIRYRDGAYPHLDAQRIVAEASACARRMIQA